MSVCCTGPQQCLCVLLLCLVLFFVFLVFFSTSPNVCSHATGELSQYSTRHKEEVASLHKSIATLDREKDALQDEVDNKTERVVVLQEENAKKVDTAQGLLQHFVKPVERGPVDVLASPPRCNFETKSAVISLCKNQRLHFVSPTGANSCRSEAHYHKHGELINVSVVPML